MQLSNDPNVLRKELRELNHEIVHATGKQRLGLSVAISHRKRKLAKHNNEKFTALQDEPLNAEPADIANRTIIIDSHDEIDLARFFRSMVTIKPDATVYAVLGAWDALNRMNGST